MNYLPWISPGRSGSSYIESPCHWPLKDSSLALSAGAQAGESGQGHGRHCGKLPGWCLPLGFADRATGACGALQEWMSRGTKRQTGWTSQSRFRKSVSGSGQKQAKECFSCFLAPRTWYSGHCCWSEQTIFSWKKNSCKFPCCVPLTCILACISLEKLDLFALKKDPSSSTKPL